MVIAGLRLANTATLSKGTFTRKLLFALRYVHGSIASSTINFDILLLMGIQFNYCIGVVYERRVRYAAFPHA
jgi:hypothetical protein